MAEKEFDHRRRMISKQFHYQLRNSEKQAFVGPPDNMREHVLAAAKSLKVFWRESTGAQVTTYKIGSCENINGDFSYFSLG